MYELKNVKSGVECCGRVFATATEAEEHERKEEFIVWPGTRAEASVRKSRCFTENNCR